MTNFTLKKLILQGVNIIFYCLCAQLLIQPRGNCDPRPKKKCNLLYCYIAINIL